MPSNPTVTVGAGRYTLPADATVLPSSAQTGAQNSPGFSTLGATALTMLVNATVNATTFTAKLQYWNEGDQSWNDFADATNTAVTAAITTTGKTKLVIDPRIVGVANKVIQSPLAAKMRVAVSAPGAGSITYSVDITLHP